jgi:predicted flap endonuclease-1-like 5' DNA nuclease
MTELLARLIPSEVLRIVQSRETSAVKASNAVDQVQTEAAVTAPEAALPKEEVPLSKTVPEEPPAEVHKQPPVEPDDLTRLPGIGPAFSSKLQAAGIHRFEDIQRKSNQEIKEILQLRSFQKLDLKALRSRAAKLVAARKAQAKQNKRQTSAKEPPEERSESEDDEE